MSATSYLWLSGPLAFLPPPFLLLPNTYGKCGCVGGGGGVAEYYSSVSNCHVRAVYVNLMEEVSKFMLLPMKHQLHVEVAVYRLHMTLQPQCYDI